MEVSLPTTVQIEVYIDPDRCTMSCVCIDMCSMGVFEKKGRARVPVQQPDLLLLFQVQRVLPAPCHHHAVDCPGLSLRR